MFDDNIRLYLGEKNEVNKKILGTALSDAAFEFWYLNNGITIVCDSFRYQPGAVSPLVEIKNPQIVNGGQTSHSLFEAARIDKNKIKKVRVLAKIIETSDSAFRNRIAEATNSQTPIRTRDLRANDQTQFKIERIFLDCGLYYERKRNQHIAQKRATRIDALKMGQILLSYYHGEPDRAKTQSDKIFGELYDLVFDENNISPQRLLTAYKLFDLISESRDLAVARTRSVVHNTYEEEWLVEGIYHVLYAVSLLCEKEGQDIFDYDAAKAKVGEAMTLVGDYVKSQKRAAAYRIFRSAHTKEQLRKHMFPTAVQMRLPLTAE